MTPALLPPDDPLRHALHDEAHARPAATIRLPALVVYLAVRHDGVARGAQLAHLRELPGHEALPEDALDNQFLRLKLGGGTLKWERHSEFTRYSLVQALPEGVGLETPTPALHEQLVVPEGWLARVPGRSLVAMQLVMLPMPENPPRELRDTLDSARRWFDGHPVTASAIGRVPIPASAATPAGGHSVVVTDFRLDASGFERMLVLCGPGTSETRAGRISQRLLELETYRLMALLGLPAAKTLGPELGAAEAQLARLTAGFDTRETSDQALLDELVTLAARLERATAEHAYRFAATQAYDAVMQQRLVELRETPVPGWQTLGEFLQRRQAPAIATVAATARRLEGLAARVERASGLLRTRVDIAAEAQNQQLLERLAQGQALQLRLQSTVEGLSIAAISYYVVSLALYAGKAAEAAGLPIHPEIAAGALLPLVLLGVWRMTRRIHDRLAPAAPGPRA
jgi:uncharacterized membrane-anchored protein